MQTTPLLQSERVEKENKMSKRNFRKDKPNFRFEIIDRNYKGMSVGTMSGGLEIIMFRTLDKIWAKLKNKFNA
jgi:hypothetical protein